MSVLVESLKSTKNMQNERTLEFWDTLHQQNGSKEWILHPTSQLCERIMQVVVTNNLQSRKTNALSILEIGCGTSTLAKELYNYILTMELAANVTFHATDVSEICIEQNQERDVDWLASNGNFAYKVLNVLESNQIASEYDLILDKGCLDTMLFRTKQRGYGRNYNKTIRTVLSNIHTWLTDTGIYMILSPRTKLKAVRDYAGFKSCNRYELDLNVLQRADLEGEGHTLQDPIFLYACQKYADFNVQHHEAFVMEYYENPQDETACLGCGISFYEFRRGEALYGRGEPFWFRRWRGHCRHCTST